MDAGRVTLHLRTKAAAAEVADDRIVSVTALNLESREAICFRPSLSSMRPNSATCCRSPVLNTDVGAETTAETGEPHAQPSEPKPHCVQSFTYVFGLERRLPHERHVIRQPTRYEVFRASQPYSLTIEVHGGEIYGEDSGWLTYKVFETMPGTKGGLWTYRRLVDQRAVRTRPFPSDLSMFNWPGND